MAYTSSNSNRWYCGRESAYGQVPVFGAANRIPAVQLQAKQEREKSTRKDKTGSRTWQGQPSGYRKKTSFDLTTYLRDWPDMTKLPPHGALVEAAMGASGVLHAGGTADAGCSASTIKFNASHGLVPGQAIMYGTEIRFVAAIADARTAVLNCPLSAVPQAGEALGATASFGLASELPSISLFDYWGMNTGVQRVFNGAGVDEFKIRLNGDFHQLQFKGMAQDVLDSASFQAGEGGLPSFPIEPTDTASYSYSVVPGNLGQVWLGAIPNQFLTIADASVTVHNNLELRANEFGSALPRAIAPGQREVLVSLELFAQDNAATTALYQAARQNLPISMMFQLGQTAGQLVGIFLKSVIPEVPEFDDSDKRLKWKFRETRVQGTADDEIAIAFA